MIPVRSRPQKPSPWKYFNATFPWVNLDFYNSPTPVTMRLSLLAAVLLGAGSSLAQKPPTGELTIPSIPAYHPTKKSVGKASMIEQL